MEKQLNLSQRLDLLFEVGQLRLEKYFQMLNKRSLSADFIQKDIEIIKTFENHFKEFQPISIDYIINKTGGPSNYGWNSSVTLDLIFNDKVYKN